MKDKDEQINKTNSEEEEHFTSNYFILHPFQPFELRETVYQNSAKQDFYNHKYEKNTSLPLWLEVRHILI